jgi:hypothetical protein
LLHKQALQHLRDSGDASVLKRGSWQEHLVRSLGSLFFSFVLMSLSASHPYC